MDKKKKTWIVPSGFRSEHVKLWAAIRHSFYHDRKCCKSKLADLADMVTLVSRAKKRTSEGNETEFLFLVTKDEKHEFNPAELSQVHRKDNLMTTICKVDQWHSKL